MGRGKWRPRWQLSFSLSATDSFSTSCRLPTPTTQILSGVRPSGLGLLTHLKSDADTERSSFSYLNWNQCYPSSGCKIGFISSALFLPGSSLFSLLPRSYFQRSSYNSTSSEKPPWHFENPRAPIICTAHPAPHQKRPYNSSALCSGFLSFYLKNINRIPVVPWPSKVFKILKLNS